MFNQELLQSKTISTLLNRPNTMAWQKSKKEQNERVIRTFQFTNGN